MGHSEYDPAAKDRRPWNVGRTVGAKRALKPQQVWAIRFWLDRERRLRDRAMFDLAIDTKLRGCDVVKVKIGDLVSGGRVRSRAIVVQQKTGRPVQFELLEPARGSILAWLEQLDLNGEALECHPGQPVSRKLKVNGKTLPGGFHFRCQPIQRTGRTGKALCGEPSCENAVNRSRGKSHGFHHADRATIDHKTREATRARYSDCVCDRFLGKLPDLACNQGDAVRGRTQGMETTFNEGDGVIDAHAGLIAGDRRLDEIAAASSILFAERKRRREHLAWMKRLALVHLNLMSTSARSALN
jgi:hypothetical protein